MDELNVCWLFWITSNLIQLTPVLAIWKYIIQLVWIFSSTVGIIHIYMIIISKLIERLTFNNSENIDFAYWYGEEEKPNFHLSKIIIILLSQMFVNESWLPGWILGHCPLFENSIRNMNLNCFSCWNWWCEREEIIENVVWFTNVVLLIG